MVSDFAVAQCGQVMVDKRNIGSAFWHGRITRVCRRGSEPVHVGHAVVIRHGRHLILVGHRNLGNAGDSFQAAFDDGGTGRAIHVIHFQGDGLIRSKRLRAPDDGGERGRGGHHIDDAFYRVGKQSYASGQMAGNLFQAENDEANHDATQREAIDGSHGALSIMCARNCEAPSLDMLAVPTQARRRAVASASHLTDGFVAPDPIDNDRRV